MVHSPQILFSGDCEAVIEESQQLQVENSPNALVLFPEILRRDETHTEV
jgi:hypothetical protein